LLDERAAKLALLRSRADSLANAALSNAENRFRTLCARLEGVNPLAVLSHGYAMVQSEDGEIVSAVGDVKTGDRLSISLSDGSIRAEVIEINKKHTG
jgi:exodeoxyribonuclease VII large subunit